MSGTISIEQANELAEEVANEALMLQAEKYEAVIAGLNEEKGSQVEVTKEELKNAASEVVTESMTNAKLIGGEILLDNIQTVAEKLILSRMSWWKKLIVSSKDTEMAVTVAVYGIVYAIKTGGFGLTKYRVNHEALDYVTLAANKRMMTYVIKALGVNTNIAESLLAMPTVETVGAE